MDKPGESEIESAVAVIGAGIMGTGIAQASAMAGRRVRLQDALESQLLRARSSIDESLARFVKAGKLNRDDAVAATKRVEFTPDLDRACNGVSVVIEAVPEILEIKQEVLGRAALSAAPDALLGTNTSQLSVTRIGAAMGNDSERLIGTHFFNPPVMMRLVELICGIRTTETTLTTAREFASQLGKEVVVCRKDSPGFITSRAYAVLRLECIRMLEEGLATPEDIDKAFRLGFNFPMGPLELGDFNGLDTYVHVLDSLTDAYGERFRPTPGLRNMVAAGHLGRKAGRGFYSYDPETGKRLDLSVSQPEG